jgi:tRNA(fMet)-specific endonuclease VapC
LVTLSLDTDILVELVNGKNPVVRERYDAAMLSGQPIAISAIVMHELMFGALISARPEHHVALVRSFAVEHEVVDWTHADVLAAARMRADLELIGQRIGSYDALLAGHALNRGWTLVTGNTREFGRVRDLDLENWSRP